MLNSLYALIILLVVFQCHPRNLNAMKNRKIAKIIIAVALILFGASALIWPSVVYNFMSYLIGGGLIVNGAVLIWEYVKTPRDIRERIYQLVGGIAFIASGIALVLIPVTWVKTALGLIVAIGLLIIGIALVSRALLERDHFDGWLIRMLIGIITLLGSAIVFSRLGDAGDTIARIIGGVAVYIGINNLLGIALIKTRSTDDPDYVDIDFTKK